MTAQELKAAILDLAIRGKLVPQDLNDEPADKLLERISVERSRVPRDRKSVTRGRAGRASLPPITDDEKSFDLPKGWAWCRLGEIIDLISGRDLEPTDYNDKGVGLIYVTGPSCLSSSGVLECRWTPVPCVLAMQGDILLVCKGAGYGKIVICDKEKVHIARQIMAIRLCDKIDTSYVMLLLTQSIDSIKQAGKGLIPGIARDVVLTLKVSLPPLAEQKRIVARIEELMPWVERYAAAEEKRGKLDAALPGQLKQSILKAAFAGALVADSVGVEKTLDSVCAGVFTGNSLSDLEKRKFTRPDGLPFIGTKDVGFDQVIAYDNGIRIPKTEDGYRIAPKGATLLCVEGGSSGRKIGLLTEDVRFGNKLCAFVPGDDLDSRYLFFFLQSPQFLEQFAALQNGPRKGAGVSQVKGLSIPMLPLAKQKALVRRIDDFLSLIQTLSVN